MREKINPNNQPEIQANKIHRRKTVSPVDKLIEKAAVEVASAEWPGLWDLDPQLTDEAAVAQLETVGNVLISIRESQNKSPKRSKTSPNL